MDVNLRQLRYFVAVADRLHFTGAAEALYVSQPALSKQIRTLETQLRTPLFVRDRRTVQLTAAGAALLRHARDVLASWQEAEAAVAAAIDSLDTTVVIGMSTGPGRGLLPALRARLSHAAPAVALRLRQIPWDDPTAGLGEGGSGVDVALVWLPLPAPGRFTWLDISTEPRLVALPGSHRLASRDTLAIEELLEEPFLALPATAGAQRDYWLAVDRRAGSAVRVGAEVRTAEETVEALAAGLGVVLLATGNAPLLDRQDIALRPVTGLEPARLVLAWRRGDDRQIVRHVRTAAGEVVRQLGS